MADLILGTKDDHRMHDAADTAAAAAAAAAAATAAAAPASDPDRNDKEEQDDDEDDDGAEEEEEEGEEEGNGANEDNGHVPARPVFSTDTFHKDSSFVSSRRSSQATLHSNISPATSPKMKFTAAKPAATTGPTTAASAALAAATTSRHHDHHAPNGAASRIPGPSVKKSLSSIPRPTTPTNRRLGTKPSRDFMTTTGESPSPSSASASASTSTSASATPSSSSHLPRRFDLEGTSRIATSAPRLFRERSVTLHTTRTHTKPSHSPLSKTTPAPKLSHDSLRDAKLHSAATTHAQSEIAPPRRTNNYRPLAQPPSPAPAPALGRRQSSTGTGTSNSNSNTSSRNNSFSSSLPRVRTAISADGLKQRPALVNTRKNVGVNIGTRKLSDRIQDLQSHAIASATVKPSSKTIPKPISATRAASTSSASPSAATATATSTSTTNAAVTTATTIAKNAAIPQDNITPSSSSGNHDHDNHHNQNNNSSRKNSTTSNMGIGFSKNSPVGKPQSLAKPKLTYRSSMRMLDSEDFATRRKKIQQAIAEAEKSAETPAPIYSAKRRPSRQHSATALTATASITAAAATVAAASSSSPSSSPTTAATTKLKAKKEGEVESGRKGSVVEEDTKEVIDVDNRPARDEDRVVSEAEQSRNEGSKSATTEITDPKCHPDNRETTISPAVVKKTTDNTQSTQQEQKQQRELPESGKAETIIPPSETEGRPMTSSDTQQEKEKVIGKAKDEGEGDQLLLPHELSNLPNDDDHQQQVDVDTKPAELLESGSGVQETPETPQEREALDPQEETSQSQTEQQATAAINKDGGLEEAAIGEDVARTESTSVNAHLPTLSGNEPGTKENVVPFSPSSDVSVALQGDDGLDGYNMTSESRSSPLKDQLTPIISKTESSPSTEHQDPAEDATDEASQPLPEHQENPKTDAAETAGEINSALHPENQESEKPNAAKDVEEIAQTTMREESRRGSEARVPQLPAKEHALSVSHHGPIAEDNEKDVSKLSAPVPADVTNSEDLITDTCEKVAASGAGVDVTAGTHGSSNPHASRRGTDVTDAGSIRSYAGSGPGNDMDEDDSFVTTRESRASSPAQEAQETSMLDIMEQLHQSRTPDHDQVESPLPLPDTQAYSPTARPAPVEALEKADDAELENGDVREDKEANDLGGANMLDMKQDDVFAPAALNSQDELKSDENTHTETLGQAHDTNSQTTKPTSETKHVVAAADSIQEEDEEQGVAASHYEFEVRPPPDDPTEGIITNNKEESDEDQRLKKRRSQIFQQTMSRRSEEHEREPMPPDVADAINAAQRQLHRPSKRWTIVSRESSVVGDALSLLSHSKKTSLSSRKCDDSIIPRPGSPKPPKRSSRRHSKQSSGGSASLLCTSEADECRSSDTNDIDAGEFDERDAASIVLPYSNETGMHVLQQHYPDLNLTDTDKARQEKASKRMTQLFLSELSKGGFDTTLLTRPELNSGRHSMSSLHLSQHRRKDSDMSWTSHDHDNISIATQESLGEFHSNSQHPPPLSNVRPKSSGHEQLPDPPCTPLSFKNAHPEHEELGISVGFTSPSNFSVPQSTDRYSRAGSLRSRSSLRRSASLEISPSPTRAPAAAASPGSPTSQRNCSPSIMSSMVGSFSRRSSLLSVASSTRPLTASTTHQSHQNYDMDAPFRTESANDLGGPIRRASKFEQNLTPMDCPSSSRHGAASGVRDKARDGDQKRLKKRRNIIKELIDTEHRFTQDMTIVVEFYMQTAPSCSGMTPENSKTLFGNADKVFQFTTRFQDELKHAARSVYSLPHSQRYQSKRSTSRPCSSVEVHNSNGTLEFSDERDKKTTIGLTFMNNAQRMEEVYAEYLKNHDSANKTLDLLQKREVVRLWLTECKGLAVGLTDAWDLDSLLVKPVQRMLKYPLLLAELLNVTPADHPDYENLQNALKETTSISVRINESKKRADVVGQVIHSSSRRRRESDVRAGLTKAFTWRGDKLKHHAERYSDHEFDLLANQFGENFFHTQLIIRDVDEYIAQVRKQVGKFYNCVSAVDSFVESHDTQNQKLERKWHKFAKTVKHFMEKALAEHISAVRKDVAQPMFQLLKLHEGPQRVMQKRNKRYIDYTRFRYIKDRHDKPDRKTTELAEQFDALNITLKEELPRLFKLSAKLMGELLGVLGHLQAVWNLEMQNRFSYVLSNAAGCLPHEDMRTISTQWAVKFAPREESVMGLSICNGSLVADNASAVGGLGSPGQATHSRRPSAISNVCYPPPSQPTSASSPKRSQDQGSSRSRSSSNLPSRIDLTMPLGNGSSISRVYTSASSYSPALSFSDLQSRISDTGRKQSSGTDTPQLSSLHTGGGSTPMLQGLPLKAPSTNDLSLRAPRLDPVQPSGTFSCLFPPPAPARAASTPPEVANTRVHRQPSNSSTSQSSFCESRVIFNAMSLYQFHIDPKRTENGYPYLSYAAGEVFGVVAELGDLWLAWNKRTPDRTVGWIWSKHFAKMQN